MGYSVEAFICKQVDAYRLTDHFDKAFQIDIGQGLSLIPMTEELFDQINNFKVSEPILDSEYLTEFVEQQILQLIGDTQFAYVEALYHGGQGGQLGLIWKDNRRFQIWDYGEDRINHVLKSFGAIANDGEDEFLTLGFGLRRRTAEWIQK